MPVPSLQSFKVIQDELSSISKFNNLVQAVEDEFGDIDGDQIATDAAIALAKLAAGTSGQIVRTEAGVPVWGPTGWTAWTPTLFQSAGVAITGNNSKYLQLGSFLFVMWDFNPNAAGSAGSVIEIRDLPIVAVSQQMGIFKYFDSGTAHYVGFSERQTTTSLVFTVHNASNQLGASPSFAVAVGDTFRGFVVYEVA